MTESFSERRLAENEVYFREYNESVQRGFENLKQMAKEQGEEYSAHDSDMELHFYCECSDEGCRNRILLTASTYTKLHKDRDQFVVLPGHEVGLIEDIVHTGPGYSVVKKYKMPPSTTHQLHKTPITGA